MDSESSYYTYDNYEDKYRESYRESYNNEDLNKYQDEDKYQDDDLDKYKGKEQDKYKVKDQDREQKKGKNYYKYKFCDDEDDFEDKFTPYVQRNIQIVYLIAAIIWLIIVYVFSLYCGNVILWLLLFIPLIIYGLNFYFVPEQTVFVTNLMFTADFLSIGFLIVTIIINWYKEVDKGPIFSLVVLALFLFGLSMLDVWVPEEKFILIQHIRSALETAGVIILVIVVYTYYLEVQKTVYFK